MLRVMRERDGIRKQILDPAFADDELEMVRSLGSSSGLLFKNFELG